MEGVLAKKSILAFGMGLPDAEGFTNVGMASDRSLLDADIIAVEPSVNPFLTEYGEGYGGTPLIDASNSFKFLQTKQRWSTELRNALVADRTIIYFLTQKVDRHYLTGERNVSGTGRSQKVSRIVAACSNYDFVPTLKGAFFTRGAEMRLDPGASILSKFWNEFGDISTYNVYFDDAVGKPLVRTKAGSRAVGALFRPKDGGRILFLPKINWDVTITGKTATAENRQLAEFSIRLRNAILELDRDLRDEVDSIEEPDWASRDEYRLDAEEELEHKILETDAKIENLTNEKVILRDRLRAETAIRGLLYEKGRALEAAVRSGLQALGFDVENFKAGDSEFDVLFTADDLRFLGEVEGKDNKPINVDKASQLQRNLGEDFAREEVSEMALGVLFGNAYRQSEIENRPSEYFTEKVVSLAKMSNIALVRTPDLFRVVRALRNRPDVAFAASCRAAIRDGIGGVVVFPEASRQEEIFSENAEE